jgi:probable F420-dependent oxidoreductase
MRAGAIFPQTEIGTDPAVIRDWAQEVEGMGYHHLLAYDHVLGASIASRPDWDGSYTSADMFHEIFVLLGYLAGLTRAVELVTGVVILPQRQTALVAKQAAEVDLLSGGRLRLGVGVGWNAVEFEALGEDFHTRGARCDEQIAVLRALWRDETVTFHGRWHTIEDAGLNPLPPRRHIPIYIGGQSDAALSRAARLGDGWMPQSPPNDATRAQIERLRAARSAAGREREPFGIETRLTLKLKPEDAWRQYLLDWQALGATHVTINTMGMGYTTLDQHLSALRRAHAALPE